MIHLAHYAPGFIAPVVRFAPSPTGRIHIGNARTALLNYIFARKHGGKFILRFDDTDSERSTEEYALGIEVDLEWLGVAPDAKFRQSERSALYEAAARRLRETGRLYPCYETPDELERKRRLQIARGTPPIYDRAALTLTDAERAAFEAAGRKAHWRFKLEPAVVRWDDLIRGDSHIDCASLSDPVLVREDGSFLYTLPSVVDDIDSGVTQIIRGEDHVTNTAVQVQLFLALGAEKAPHFGHHNLLVGADGQGLSKRAGALSIASLREAGVESLAVAAMATLTGSSIAVQPVHSFPELAGLFDLSAISRNSARFDDAELRALSQRVLHGLPYDSVRDRLAAQDIVGFKAEPFWLAARGNLTRFSDVADWWSVVEGDVTVTALPDELRAAAVAALPAEPWDETSWGVWTTAVKEATGLKGKALFHPLRLALTGRESGPELAKLLPLIGRARALARLGA
ncbi:glutamate--tRNA ligase [Rhodoblastus acidophilus]|uniref:Glutamate--tRNA ligase n=1 Tax=Candidatus Rhodoblastus alkanivorans TaxID=2954117 RepID=A0ABS9Z4X7_9HYPH|nr:glutamate--tRNA ligase [Candidatus Rhodoblastus alkanivorans]MCI4677585.1 glutamate--tRNA ligase [Candidatus Rhodoblastus alkanivorans]MCI4682683.1 glutamate--tRNA ligase [Candidatus Rhodoblastus alkanivorans]MDI4639990.1 glutamate--tRNA ligase [Rhodoblastus acidophilus]